MSNYIPNIEDIYRDRTLYIKEMETYLEKLKKEKENKSMGNTENFEKVLGKKNANVGKATVNAKADLGKSLKDTLADACSKFIEWMEASQVVLEAFDNMKEMVKTMEDLDNSIVELQKVTDKTVAEM